MWKLLMLGALAAGAVSAAAQGDWQLAKNPLYTKWGKNVDPLHVLPEYPRPQMVRADWINLNGVWDLALNSKRAPKAAYDQKILVPFPVESALSGVKGIVDTDTIIRYRRQIAIPEVWTGKRVLIHFGAVDWQATVKVNGKEVGSHKGGYDPFSFDVTSALQPAGQQTVEVEVTDPTDSSTQPRGKQVSKPGGIFYTPTSGIWQTVWLEPVPEHHIEHLVITPNLDRSQVVIRAELAGAEGLRLEASASDGEKTVAESTVAATHEMVLRIPHPRLWSPKSAFLYRLDVKLLPRDTNVPIDEVQSYFGMRKISVQKDGNVNKIFLNGHPQFMIGPLDQGFWPDGLYTAPSDEALRSDLITLKSLGFNMIRKHVKVEPERWYYWCDKMGLLVWQDMPSGDKFIGEKDPDIQRTPESAADFEAELQAIVHARKSHPCIVMWVLFNEGWGQYDTARLTKWLKEYDSSRLVDSTSGWADRGVGDVEDMHNYPGPGSPKPSDVRAAVLGEFGGLGLPVPGHMWTEKGWGYKEYKTPDELTNAFLALVGNVRPLMSNPGLSAAVYTQTSDVETELNGLMTYDRAILKINADEVRKAIDALYGPPPNIDVVVPTSQGQATNWTYTTYKPDVEWTQPAYDDAKWATGQGGFGTKGTPGSVVGTTWDGADIWLRRTFIVPKSTRWHSPNLLLYHDDDAEVYIDGTQVAALSGYVTTYTLFPIRDGAALLTPGKHTLAIHCRQVSGGQFIDAGIVDVSEPVVK